MRTPLKSILVETAEYMLTVCRYVERNPVCVGLAERVEQWRWSSAGMSGSVPLQAWALERPTAWLDWVNESETTNEYAPCGTHRRPRPVIMGLERVGIYMPPPASGQ